MFKPDSIVRIQIDGMRSDLIRDLVTASLEEPRDEAKINAIAGWLAEVECLRAVMTVCSK